MNFFFDSSYFFPLIKIEIKNSLKPLLEIYNKKNRFLYSTITLFELSAKGAKYINSEELLKSDVVNGINSLCNWKIFEKVEPWQGEIQRLAFDFRKQHADYIDSIILASAITHSDVLISEDERIKGLVKSFDTQISILNNNFACMNTSEVYTKLITQN